MPVLLPATRTTDMGTSRGDDSTPRVVSNSGTRTAPSSGTFTISRSRCTDALDRARDGESIAAIFRAVRRCAPRRAHDGYVACSLIANAGAVVETVNDPDTLWEGGET